ncbi:hypothetical protein GCM10009530_26220 [Microbispora corallina]|uniref:Uncharacterized protein n=1 Tax=Microbispora corallina TaxID=83302 RepID=A0ABQ4G4Y7_9ACTN|nr:hypothetical protein Mco01_51040 [Microbispora corallina]
MYRYVWRRLPGSTPFRLLIALLLAAAVAAALWYVVFPWLAPRLPLE